MRNEATETNETYIKKLKQLHESGISLYDLSLDLNISTHALRNFIQGKKVTKKIFNRIETWINSNP